MTREELKELSFLERMVMLQNDLKAPKNAFNKFGGYKYRQAEDILEALKPLCLKYSIFIFLTDKVLSAENFEYDGPIQIGRDKSIKVSNKGNEHIVSTVKAIDMLRPEEDMSFRIIEASGVAHVDYHSAGMSHPQRTGSACTYAVKRALGNLLLLDDTRDDDATSTHGKPKGLSSAIKKRITELLSEGKTAMDITNMMDGKGMDYDKKEVLAYIESNK